MKRSRRVGLPIVSKGAIWADGRGRTREDAILDGRRIVSQQLVSKLSVKSSPTDHIIHGNEHGTHVRIRSLTHFKDAELIRTLGVVEQKSGYVARVALQKTEAARVYQKVSSAVIEARWTCAHIAHGGNKSGYSGFTQCLIFTVCNDLEAVYL